MESQLQKGYLLLADISGYTAFMANTELDHAPMVLHHIISFLTNELTPTLHLAEVEGDAIFLYRSETDISRGELLLELMEATYINFRNRKRTMMHNITCPCKACQAVKTLDLKFVLHYGDYMLQKVTGKVKPFGSCVNLAHRLLKNSVTKTAGWQGYVIFSNICLDKMNICPENIHKGIESYEHFGEVPTGSINFEEKYRAYTTDRIVFLSSDEADITIEYTFSAEPPIIWDWLNDPVKRNKWDKRANWETKERPHGRTGHSASNHCTSSKFIEHILDWRPFHYFTVCYHRGWINVTITGELKPVNGGTKLYWRMKLEGKLPRWLSRGISKLVVNKILKMKENFAVIEQLTKKQLDTSQQIPIETTSF